MEIAYRTSIIYQRHINIWNLNKIICCDSPLDIFSNKIKQITKIQLRSSNTLSTSPYLINAISKQ